MMIEIAVATAYVIRGGLYGISGRFNNLEGIGRFFL